MPYVSRSFGPLAIALTLAITPAIDAAGKMRAAFMNPAEHAFAGK